MKGSQQNMMASPIPPTPGYYEDDAKLREQQKEQNLQCAKEFGIPECLVHRTCTPEELGLNSKDGYTYNQSRCWELCVGLKRGNSVVASARVKKFMRELDCNKYRSGIYKLKGLNTWIIVGVGLAVLWVANKQYKWL